jgi:hypothetical protein
MLLSNRIIQSLQNDRKVLELNTYHSLEIVGWSEERFILHLFDKLLVRESSYNTGRILQQHFYSSVCNQLLIVKSCFWTFTGVLHWRIYLKNHRIGYYWTQIHFTRSYSAHVSQETCHRNKPGDTKCEKLFLNYYWNTHIASNHSIIRWDITGIRYICDITFCTCVTGHLHRNKQGETSLQITLGGGQTQHFCSSVGGQLPLRVQCCIQESLQLSLFRI